MVEVARRTIPMFASNIYVFNQLEKQLLARGDGKHHADAGNQLKDRSLH